MDGFANSSKPYQIKNFLTKNGFEVDILNTMFISRLGESSKKQFLPSAKPLSLTHYLLESLSFIQKKFFNFSRKDTYYYLLRLQMHIRKRLLLAHIVGYNHIICESPIDSLIFLNDLGDTNKIYDCATPIADELYFGNEINTRQYRSFKKLEIKIYKSVDHLSFHWQSYADYVKKYYADINNITVFSFGVDSKKEHAHYSKKPRIVYMGYLGGYWINLELLSALSKLYDIDVYGGPEPPQALGLNYCGYAKPDKLLDYQFGLVTLSKDRLRNEGFSAKHLEYLSYGLPVLMPEWRTVSRSIKGTIHYNKGNFLSLIQRYSNKKEWNKLSQQALKQSQQYSWNNTLKPLLKMLNG